MDESQENKKAIKILGGEGLLITVLIVLIVITFNYFNILPVSKVIPILPHKDIKENKNLVSQNSLFSAGGKCENLPKDIKINIKKPSSTVSKKLAKFSGIWQGKWGGKIPATLIINEITPSSVYTIYIFNKVQPQVISFKVQGNIIAAPPFTWSMPNENVLVGGYQKSASSPASLINMKRCQP